MQVEVAVDQSNKTQTAMPTSKPHLPLKTRVWNKIGSAMILIGLLGYFHDLGALMSGDAPPHGLSPDQLTYLFLGSMLLLVLGVLIRSRGIWPYLFRKVGSLR